MKRLTIICVLASGCFAEPDTITTSDEGEPVDESTSAVEASEEAADTEGGASSSDDLGDESTGSPTSCSPDALCIVIDVEHFDCPAPSFEIAWLDDSFDVMRVDTVECDAAATFRFESDVAPRGWRMHTAECVFESLQAVKSCSPNTCNAKSPDLGSTVTYPMPSPESPC